MTTMTMTTTTKKKHTGDTRPGCPPARSPAPTSPRCPPKTQSPAPRHHTAPVASTVDTATRPNRQTPEGYSSSCLPDPFGLVCGCLMMVLPASGVSLCLVLVPRRQHPLGQALRVSRTLWVHFSECKNSRIPNGSAPIPAFLPIGAPERPRNVLGTVSSMCPTVYARCNDRIRVKGSSSTFPSSTTPGQFFHSKRCRRRGMAVGNEHENENENERSIVTAIPRALRRADEDAPSSSSMNCIVRSAQRILASDTGS